MSNNNLPALQLPAIAPGQGRELTYMDMYQLGEIYAKSTMFPEHLRNKPADCFIVVQLAERLNADHFLIAQSTYVVHGKPGMEAKLTIALINRSGIFKDRLNFRLEGQGETRQATAYATDKNGKLREATYKLSMAAAEGLTTKAGNKYKSMADIMLCYRAATVFARLYCPDVIMGMNVLDDNRQIIDVDVEVIEETSQPYEAPAVESVIDTAPAAKPEEKPAELSITQMEEMDPSELSILQMRQVYSSWNDDRKKAYQKHLDGFQAEGRDKDDAIRAAYTKTLNK